MMLKYEDLFSLEQYARIRPEFRARVMAHKKNRIVRLGDHATLHFEDRLTMQYQVQEMLRLERLFEPDLIQAELDVYNPLIPDGSNWKATFMLEYPDPEERKIQLTKLIGIEHAVWVQVAGFPRVVPVANEDLDRTAEGKTSSVHFLRFELDPAMITALKSGAVLTMGIDHPNYRTSITPTDAVKASLIADLA